jgi:protein-S-isoprenylcysteine O-methyltransferase Ste14
VVLAAGLAFAAWGFAAQRAAGTSLIATQPSTRIVTQGPYRLSRNPTWWAWCSSRRGVSLLVDTRWCLASLVPAIALVHWGAIAREERCLEAKFGEEYLAHERRVRSWS